MAKQIGAPTSGSIRADTFSRNTYGAYVRNRSIPVNPNTAAQNAVRTRFAAAVAAWSALSSGQRASWETYAALHPRTNSLGEQYVLTAQAAFNSLYFLSLAASLTPPTSAPADEAWGQFEPTLVASIDTTGPIVRVLSISAADQPTGAKGIIFSAGPTSLGRRTPVKWAQIAVVALDDWSTPKSIGSAYTMRWGNFSADQRLYVRVHAVSAAGARGPQWTGNIPVSDVTP